MPKQKKLTHKKLVAFLMDHRKIDLITIDKAHIICQCAKSFMPEDLKKLMADINHESNKLSTSQGVNYIILNRS